MLPTSSRCMPTSDRHAASLGTSRTSVKTAWGPVVLEALGVAVGINSPCRTRARALSYDSHKPVRRHVERLVILVASGGECLEDLNSLLGAGGWAACSDSYRPPPAGPRTSSAAFTRSRTDDPSPTTTPSTVPAASLARPRTPAQGLPQPAHGHRPGLGAANVSRPGDPTPVGATCSSLTPLVSASPPAQPPPLAAEVQVRPNAGGRAFGSPHDRRREPLGPPEPPLAPPPSSVKLRLAPKLCLKPHAASPRPSRRRGAPDDSGTGMRACKLSCRKASGSS